MARYDTQQFDIVRHRIRGLRAPYLVVLQHPDIPSSTILAAPLTPAEPGDHPAIAPSIVVDGQELRLRLLDMAAVHHNLLLDKVGSASAFADAVTLALDIIFSGYPIGGPH
jgi:hypothetical protein